MRFFLAALAVLLLAPIARAADPLLAPTSVCRKGSAIEMFCLHAQARKKAGLPPLQRVSVLYESAGRKADRIVECGQFTHYPCGDAFACPASVPYCGENLAMGYPTIRDTFAAWLASPGHRANILHAGHRYYGSAFRVGYPRLWVVQLGS